MVKLNDKLMGHADPSKRPAEKAPDPKGIFSSLSQLLPRFRKRSSSSNPTIESDVAVLHRTIMVPSKPPVGLNLSDEHKVGHLMREGAFGPFHLVDSGEKRKVWACKVVPLPTETMIHQISPQEVACARLYWEYRLCKSQFSSLCGKILPRLPSQKKNGLQFYFENNSGTRLEMLMFTSLLTNRTGYRCIVMEKMECLFFDGIQPLVQSYRGESEIPLGQIACKLMDIVEAIHNKNHVLVDIKPDNLMLATLSGKVTDESIAKSLRLLDLGLVASFRTTGGHRDDEGIANIQGTPLYASLNVHELRTPSRRDDVEAMLYVIAELVLMVHGILLRTDPPYQQQSFLPWMEGGSDAAIRNIKKRCVQDLESEFYAAMPKDAASILHKLIGSAQAMTYKKKPDYELFRDALKMLHVPVLLKSAIIERDDDDDEYDSDVSMKTRSYDATVCRGPSTKSGSIQLVGLDDPIVLSKGQKIVVGSDPQEQGDTLLIADGGLRSSHVRFSKGHLKNTVQVTPIARSLVLVAGNKVPITGTLAFLNQTVKFGSQSLFVQKVAAEGPGPSSKSGSIQLVGLEHPIVLSKGQEIVVGSDPQDQGDTLLIADGGLRSSHVRFSKGHLKNTVQVTPIARSLVLVAGNKVPITGTLAFLNQTVKFGSQSLFVQNVQASRPSETESGLKENKVPGKNSKQMTRSAQGTEEDSDADAYIIITTGSQKGEYFSFTKEQPSMIIGSAPTSRKGFHVVLQDGEGVDADHVHLELSVRRGVVICTVRDLNTKTGTFLNRDQITSGAAFCGSSVITVGKVAMELVRKIP